jgi:hypothetical protein
MYTPHALLNTHTHHPYIKLNTHTHTHTPIDYKYIIAQEGVMNLRGREGVERRCKSGNDVTTVSN